MAGGILTLIRRLLIGEPAPPRLEQGQTDNRHITIFGPTEEIPPVLPNSHARLVFAVDATASRSAAWEAAKELTDALFQALPGTLDVALAVHGGNKVHTFTQYVSDAHKLRDLAASIKCKAGETRLLDILDRVTWETPKAQVVVYIGDCFEESARKAQGLADKLKAQGTRVIILQDGHDGKAADVFASIAARSGGAVLPFDLTSLKRLRELLSAVAMLAVGGEQLLKAKQGAQPGARLLLEGLSTARLGEGKKRLGR